MTINRNLPVSPMPGTLGELLARRTMPVNRSLNDMTDQTVTKLYPNENFRKYLDALHDSQAVEGSLSADNYEACRMIREQAKRDELPLANEKLATINRALGVVLRRYKADRKTRAATVAGQMVQPETGAAD